MESNSAYIAVNIIIVITIIIIIVILFIYLFIYFHSIAYGRLHLTVSFFYTVWTFICGDILKAGNASTGCDVEDS